MKAGLHFYQSTRARSSCICLEYPDYMVRRSDRLGLLPCVLCFESKGEHLSGSNDTEYKKRVANYFSKIGQRPATWQKVTWRDAPDLQSATFQKHRFLFEVIGTENRNWRDELHYAITRSEFEDAAEDK